MDRQDFNKIVTDAVQRSIDVMIVKNQEYATGQDAFRNFKDGASISFHDIPEKYLWELMTKHLQSIKDIVKEIESIVPDKKLIDEKFGDAHNYLYLLEGLITERKKNAE